jgi:hypothetical protein
VGRPLSGVAMASPVRPYIPALAELLEPRTMSLGAGSGNRDAYPKLKALKPQMICGQAAVVDRDMALAVLAGLWLYHDFLDESHAISQSIETPTGSYWHAKYWFRRVSRHPVFEALRSEGPKVGGPDDWDPFHFVDACERAVKEGGVLERSCREIQMKEWWALFDYCYRGAVGS